jgi:hypothetical protein
MRDNGVKRTLRAGGVAPRRCFRRVRDAIGKGPS